MMTPLVQDSGMRPVSKTQLNSFVNKGKIKSLEYLIYSFKILSIGLQAFPFFKFCMHLSISGGDIGIFNSSQIHLENRGSDEERQEAKLKFEWKLWS